MSYKGPMRRDKMARRVGETKQFANKRKKSRVRNKIAKASRKNK
jgi:hypothetical protein